nr:NnrS family protein [Azospirillum brasilense]
MAGAGLLLVGASRLGAPFAETPALHLALMGGLGLGVLAVFAIPVLFHTGRTFPLPAAARLALPLLVGAVALRVLPELGALPAPRAGGAALGGGLPALAQSLLAVPVDAARGRGRSVGIGHRSEHPARWRWIRSDLRPDSSFRNGSSPSPEPPKAGPLPLRMFTLAVGGEAVRHRRQILSDVREFIIQAPIPSLPIERTGPQPSRLFSQAPRHVSATVTRFRTPPNEASHTGRRVSHTVNEVPHTAKENPRFPGSRFHPPSCQWKGFTHRDSRFGTPRIAGTPTGTRGITHR